MVNIPRLTEAQALALLTPYSDSDTNTNIHVFLDVDDGDTLKGIFFNSLEPTEKEVRPLSGGSDSSIVYKYEFVLDKADVNGLNATPITCTRAQLGLTGRQCPAIVQGNTQIDVACDGVPFVIGGDRLRLLNTNGDAIVAITGTQIESATILSAVVPSVNPDTLVLDLINPALSLDATGAITNGGANSTIKVTVYYRKVTI